MKAFIRRRTAGSAASWSGGGRKAPIGIYPFFLGVISLARSSWSISFRVRVQNYYVNSRIRERGPVVDTGPTPATQGVGAQAVLTPLDETRTMDDRNMPSAVVELLGAEGSLGTWLVSPWLDPQEVKSGNKTWRLALRWERNYTPFSMQLLEARH